MISRNLPRSLVAVILAAFFVVNLFGAAYGIGMQTNTQGKMTGCVFSGTALCTMTPFEHLAAWQSTFTATTTQTNPLLTLLLLSAALIAAFMAIRPLFDATIDLLESRQRLYLQRARVFAYINPLQEAFSQGILNPKLY